MFDSDLNSGFIEEDNINIANQFSNFELIHNSKKVIANCIKPNAMANGMSSNA